MKISMLKKPILKKRSWDILLQQRRDI
jgi:hypothetical protein